MIELKRRSPDDGMDIYNLLQQIPREENGLQNRANGLSFDEFKQWLIQKQQQCRSACENGREYALLFRAFYEKEKNL